MFITALEMLWHIFSFYRLNKQGIATIINFKKTIKISAQNDTI